MSDQPPSAPTPGTPFAPRALVPINVGHSTVDLYLIINQTMLPHEHAHAFHINKTALSSQSMDLRVQLNAFGHQLNLSATVNGLINNWFQHFHDRCFDFGSLVILSFHNRKGNQVNDTTDPLVLLAVVDGAIVNCCKKFKFVHVQLSVNFINLVTVANPGPATLRIEYYIKLPQSTCQMTNNRGCAYTLTTFLGTANLHTLTSQQIQAKILNHTVQDGPVKLQPASFGATSARMDPLAIQDKIQGKILCFAYQSICQTLFLELCPGYSNQPHAALDHIRQVHTDCNGNPVSSLVQAYYQQLMSASRPFSSQWDNPVSMCACFQDGLDPCLLTEFCLNFPQHSVVQSLNAANQRKVLQEMLQATQQAEDDFLMITWVSCEAVGLSQAST
jgi:hypothetical protein